MKNQTKLPEERISVTHATPNSHEINRTIIARWNGDLKNGYGTFDSKSGVLEEAHYNFKTRFEEENIGINPEELLGAAHAGCFTMSVAATLGENGYFPILLETKATVSMQDHKITKIHLRITAEVDTITQSELDTLATDAKKNCMISKILNIPITSEAYLVEQNKSTATTSKK